MPAEDFCDCPDCRDSEDGPCAMDCDLEDECAGCRQARMDDQELKFINEPKVVH